MKLSYQYTSHNCPDKSGFLQDLSPAYEAIHDKQSAAALYFPSFSNGANLRLSLDMQNTKGV